jgi:hypothetical protein
MARERLEKRLDSLFADQLTSQQFLENCIQEMERRHAHDDSAAHIQRLVVQISSLREKRSRVMDAFFEGAIGREDRNTRLAAIDRDTQSAQDAITRSNPATLVNLELLVEAFAPLLEWEHWSRDEKRSVLATIVPDIRVADYQVTAMGLHPTIFSNKDTRSPADTTTTVPASAIARRP